MRKPTAAMILKLLEAEKKRVAKARDEIRSLRQDMEEYEDAWSDALESIDYAIDKISELI